MPRAPLPDNELQRLEALRLCDILDTPPEPAFDELTKMAAQLCAVPVALIGLVDSERQWFKSSFGYCIAEAERDSAFCAHAILADGPFIISDTSLDPRTSDNPLVTGPPFVRFYAGIPLRSLDGFTLGTICVLDVRSRTLSADQIAGLQTLAHQVELLLQQRKNQNPQTSFFRATAKRRFHTRWLAATIFVLGMMLTAVAAWTSHDSIRMQARQRFERLSDRLLHEATRRANQVVYGLRGARGVFAADLSVSRDQFARYVASRDLQNEFPGATGFGFINRVPRADVNTFIAAQKADGAGGFAMHTVPTVAANTDDLYVVNYVNPIDQNPDLLGFDAGSDPRWRTAIEQCIASGNSAITECYELTRNGHSRAAYTYFVPVYRFGSIHETAEQRETQLIGIVFAPVVVDDALGGVADTAQGLLSLQIFDVDHTGAETEIFDSDATGNRPRDERAVAQDSGLWFQSEFPLSVCEHPWKVRTVITPKFAQSFDQSAPVIIALAGSLLSSLLAALVWSFGSGKARAIALANRMTADLHEATRRAETTARQLNAKSIALTVQRGRLELALSGGGIGSWDWNPQTGELNFDHRWSTIIGEDPGTVQFAEWKARVHPDDVDDAQACVDRHFHGRAPSYESAHRVRHKDGSWAWIRSRGVVVSRDTNGNPARVVGITENITSQKLAEEANLSAVAILRRTGEMAKVGGWELDVVTREMTWTEQLYHIHEVPLGTKIRAEDAISFYAPEARPAVELAIQTAIRSHISWDLELPLITGKGGRIWVRSQGEPIVADGDVVKLCGAFQDITDRKEAEEQLRLSATHDKLTGLANRALLHDRLQQCIHRSHRSPERVFAVLFLDFDRFKLINDTLGHEAGDDLLKMIAARLRSSLRPSDSVAFGDDFSMASRLGGDEFVVILDEIACAEDAQVVADRLLETFAAPYSIGQHEMVSSASIGIVTSNSTYATADEMLRDADTAMYEAKMAGKARYVVFDVAMRERIEGLVRIENDLRSALELKQFSLVYQPIISLQSGQIAGMEALIRWNHPVRGLILPSRFIPIAEESGQILGIGEWVLQEACAQFMRWQQTMGDSAPPSISVNLSRTQLTLANLPETIKNILSDCGMRPACLHLEVTETAVMRDAAASAGMLRAIKSVGVKLEMDDFGTGHSSLASLHQFPIDVLKIDQSFVKNVDRGRDFGALVQAIVQLARNLDIEVVAEGIETTEQAVFLGTLDCGFGQGYLFSKPLAAQDVPHFMAQPLTMQTLQLQSGSTTEAAA